MSRFTVLCNASWRICWMAILTRAEPDGWPKRAFTEVNLSAGRAGDGQIRRAILCVAKLARLGGYLG